MKPESKKNRDISSNKAEGNTASPSCYNLTALSQALDDQTPVIVNKKKDKSCFDLGNISDALNNVAKKEKVKEKKRLRVLRSIAQSKEEAKTRQIRERRLRYIRETLLLRNMAGGRMELGEKICAPLPMFSMGDLRRGGMFTYWFVPGFCRTERTIEEVMDDNDASKRGLGDDSDASKRGSGDDSDASKRGSGLV